MMEWDWEKSNEQHYNYPWELDCTVYRKEDVVRLIEEEEKIMFSLQEELLSAYEITR